MEALLFNPSVKLDLQSDCLRVWRHVYPEIIR